MRKFENERFEARAVLAETKIRVIDAGFNVAEAERATVGEGCDDYAGRSDRSVALLAD